MMKMTHSSLLFLAVILLTFATRETLATKRHYFPPPPTFLTTATMAALTSVREERESTLNTKNQTIAFFNTSNNIENWRKTLPSQLQNRGTLHHLFIEYGDGGSYCEVYLLGTSHVSNSSCEDVKLLMEHVVPDCLFIELCPERIPILAPPPTLPPSLQNTTSSSSLYSQIRTITKQTGMTPTSALSTILLTKIQSDYADKLHISVGAEFRQAFLLSSHQCRVILGDRPVQITLLRAWESLSFFGKIKLFFGLVYSFCKQPSEDELLEWMERIFLDDNGDVLTESIKELSRHFPTLGEVIIKERDEYMYAKLIQTVRVLGAKKIVAVVGAGHCPGICQLFRDTEKKTNDVEELLRKIVETKQLKVDGSEDVRSLVTDVIELNMDPSSSFPVTC